MLAGDVMALEHALELRDLLLELADELRMTDDDADERGDVLANPPRVDDSAVAGDHFVVFELLDALDHRRRRQPNLLADLGQRQLAVLLQQRQNMEVDLVEFAFCLS